MRRIALVLGICLAGGVAATWFLGGRLSAPAASEIGPPPATLPGAVDVRFASASGSVLRGWFAPGLPGRGTVVLAHPVRADRRSMASRAAFLQRAGYSVLLYDSQAHGESPGERITFGYREALDAAAAVSFAVKRHPGDPVAFIGVSQGGAAALLGPEPLGVDALVLEAVYPTLREGVANRLAIRLGEPGRLLAPLLLWQIEPRLGVSWQALEPIRGIENAKAPLLVVNGERDRHTSVEEARALFRAAPQPKELWVVPGATHDDVYAVAGPQYERRILGFLQKYLGDEAEDTMLDEESSREKEEL